MQGLSLVAANGGHSSSRCAGLSLSRALLLRSTGSRRAGSVIVAHGPSCSAACGILPDQGSNPCPLRWQADSQPLRHQGSPRPQFSATRVNCLNSELHGNRNQCFLFLVLVMFRNMTANARNSLAEIILRFRRVRSGQVTQQFQSLRLQFEAKS